MSIIIRFIALILFFRQVLGLGEKSRVGAPRQRPDGSRRIHLDWLSVEHANIFRALGGGNLSAGIRIAAQIAQARVLLVCPVCADKSFAATYADLYAASGYLECEHCGTRCIERAAMDVIDARVGQLTLARQELVGDALNARDLGDNPVADTNFSETALDAPRKRSKRIANTNLTENP